MKEYNRKCQTEGKIREKRSINPTSLIFQEKNKKMVQCEVRVPEAGAYLPVNISNPDPNKDPGSTR